MNYEKNKEALAIVKQMVADGQISQEVAEKYFPELAESEDERIRKEIIDFATKANNGVTSILANNYNFNKWIALLEKKGEQKTVVTIPKFRVGDVIRPKGSTAEYTIESISGECYHGKGWGLHLSNDDDYELVEQKPAEWSEIEPIIQHLDNLGNTAMADILRSFEPQPQWKPSEEQMVALDGICSYIRNKADWEISQDMVSDLYKLSEQLKKLREE